MGSNTDEFSDKTCPGNAFTQYSVNAVIPIVKSSAEQHTVSETSNTIKVSSSHGSFSEDAESKASVRTLDVSVGSECAEMLPRFSAGGVADDHQHKDPKYIHDYRTSVCKLEKLENLEGDDDNIICVSGTNSANKIASYHHIAIKDREIIPCSSASASIIGSEVYGKTSCLQTNIGCVNNKIDFEERNNELGMQSRQNNDCIHNVPSSATLLTELASLKVDLVGTTSVDMDDGANSAKVQRTCSPTGRSLSWDPNIKNLKEDLCSHFKEELIKEVLDPSFRNGVASEFVCGLKSASDGCGDTENSRVTYVERSSKIMEDISSNSKAETGNDSTDPPAEALISLERTREVGMVKQLPGSPDTQETSLPCQSMDESDEYDNMEHDVKVCDICGDAGQEDLLAICSRCSDGAEHIYCMRDMLEKVPEGDWICEDCKFEEVRNQKQDNNDAVDRSERNKSCGQATDVNTNGLVKTDVKESNDAGKRVGKDISSVKAACKRQLDNTEVHTASKRQALEPVLGSLKASNLGRLASFSRDSTFRNLDKGKVKLGQQSSSGFHSISDMPQVAGARLQTSRGSLMKSNSFNSLNVKPKVKLVDEVVSRKQKSVKEHFSLDGKEGAVRLIHKSMSFKSPNSGCSNTSESKVKMISPKLSGVQDLRRLKQVKDRNLFERKNSFRSERSERLSVRSTSTSSPTSTTKVEQKPATCGEAYSVSSASSSLESKPVQPDSKSTSVSKLTNRVSSRASEMAGPTGEVKRQFSAVGSSSINGSSPSVEQKLQIRPKDNSLLNDADKPLCNGDDTQSEGSLWLPESTNPAERIRDASVNQLRQISTSTGRGVPCFKCKEIGHTAQFCTVNGDQALVVDSSSVRSSREVMNGGNKLKAAIEVAMLKKPGIYRKNRSLYKPDELSTSSANLNCEIASHDQLSNIRTSCDKPVINSVKQFPALSIETLNSTIGNGSGGKPIRDLPCHDASTAISVLLEISAIPDYEYIWQGGFEIHRTGKLPQICDGMQAHLSTCASPKVLEMVRKFPGKVLLNEVPRLNTWPMQFQEIGVKEDNIALYFFARDLESYKKTYESLLESMMKSDVALKGNIDGVELLIFPSNQLPEKSQRWNLFFFLWGVFRIKRVNCSQHISAFHNKLCTTRDIPASASLSSSICPLGADDKDVLIADKSGACVALPVRELPCSLGEINGNYDIGASSLHSDSQCIQANVVRQDCELDSTSVSRIQMSSSLSSQERRFANPLLENHFDLDSKLDAELYPSVLAIKPIRDSNGSEKTVKPSGTPVGGLHSSPHFLKILPDGTQKVGVIGSIGEEEGTLSRVNGSNDQVKFLWKLEEEEGSLDANDAREEERVLRDLTMERTSSWQFNDRKCPHIGPPEKVLQASATATQTTSWSDVNSMVTAGCGSEERNTGCGEYTVYNTFGGISSVRDGIASWGQDAGSCSLINEEKCDEACDKIVIPGELISAEKHLFPIDPPPRKNFDLGGNSESLEVISSKGDHLHDVAPSLELALGAEMKSRPGMAPFLVSKIDRKNDQDDPPQNLSTKGEDGVSASLSLSLSFPFTEEQTAKPVSETERLLPERPHINTSLLLFGGISEK